MYARINGKRYRVTGYRKTGGNTQVAPKTIFRLVGPRGGQYFLIPHEKQFCFQSKNRHSQVYVLHESVQFTVGV